MTSRIGSANLVMLTIVTTAAGRSSPAADWSETLNADASAAYLTNPTFVPGSSLTDRSAKLSVDGALTMQAETGQLSVTPRFAVTRYDKETNLDIESGSIDLLGLHRFERGQWTFDAQALTDSTVTSELGLTGITSVNVRHNQGSASTGYSYSLTERLSWQTQASYQVSRYNNASPYGLSGYDYGSLQLGPTWELGDRFQGSLSLSTDRVSATATTQKDYTASLQLQRSVTERYSWQASIGGTRVEAGGAGAQTTTVFGLQGFRHGERVQLNLSVKQAVLPIGNGLLAREQTASLGATVSSSERSTLTFTVNGVRSFPVVLPVGSAYGGATWEQASAEWRYVLSPRWTLSALYAQSRARTGGFTQWGNGRQARLDVVWQSGRL